MHPPTIHPWLNPLITIVALIGLVYVLNSQQSLLIPLVIAFFLALLLLPSVRSLEHHHVPRILANLLMILATVIVIAGVAILLSFALSQFIGDLPQYQSSIGNSLVSVQEFVTRLTGTSVAEQQVWIDQNVNFFSLGVQNISSIVSRAGTITSNLVLVFVYTFFLLYYRDKIKVFLQKLFGGRTEERILHILKKISVVIPQYLLGVFTVMVILAAINSLGLWAIGVNNPIFWGVLIAVLNVIPYVGTIVGFAALILFTLLTQGLTIALLAIGVFLLAQFIDNNFLTPLIAGGKIDINPLAAIIGLIAIGSLWGVAGLILALPVVGIIKIICDTIPRYHAWGYLLGNDGTEEHAVTWRNIKNFFKKS